MRTRFLPAIFALIAVFGASGVPARADTVATPRGLSVTDLTLPFQDGAPRSIHMPLVRAQVANPTAQEQPVTISLGRGHSTSWGSDIPCEKVSSSVRIAPGATAVLELPLPHAYYGYYVSADVADASGNAVQFFTMNLHGSHAPLYLSKRISAEALEDRLSGILKADAQKFADEKGTSGYYTPDPEPTPPLERATAAAQPWPEDPRAYGPYGAVLVAREDFDDIPDGAATALADYAADGGAVAFVGFDAVPPSFERRLFADPTGGAEGGSAADGFTERRTGLGSVLTIATDAAHIDDLPEPAARRLIALSKNDDHDPFALPDPDDAARHGRTRFGPFLIILTVFSILAGPVLLRILARRDRRIQVLWILPCASVVVSVGILAYQLLSEGVTPTLKRHETILLDQSLGRAVTTESVSLYSPISLGREIAFDRWAAAGPHVIPGTGYSKIDSAGRHVVVDGKARYRGGWAAPRTLSAFKLRKTGPIALRLAVEAGAGGEPAAVNAFGVPIRSLRLVDETGNGWEAGETAPGATVQFRPADAKPFRDAIAAAVRPDRWGNPGEMAKTSPAAPPPLRRVYIAELEGAPFLGDPLEGASALRTDTATVYGSY